MHNYQYYVYLLECADGTIYTGITNNIERRLFEHDKGLNSSCYTFNRRPLKFLFHEVFNDVLQALYFEKKIKKWSSNKKRALANGDFDMLVILSECRNWTHYKYGPNFKEIK